MVSGIFNGAVAGGHSLFSNVSFSFCQCFFTASQLGLYIQVSYLSLPTGYAFSQNTSSASSVPLRSINGISLLMY